MDEDKYRDYIFDKTLSNKNLIIADFNEPKQKINTKIRFIDDALQMPVKAGDDILETTHTKIEKIKIEREYPNRIMKNEIIVPEFYNGESTRINKEKYIR